MKIQAIIPSAGIGARFKADRPKPLVHLSDKPLFLYTLEAFEASPCVSSIIVVANETHLVDFEEIISRQGFKKIAHVIPGGETRADSVFLGLQMLDEDTEAVLVHDGVRPFVTVDLIEQVAKALERHQAVVTAVPMKPTIKRVDPSQMVIQETIPRDNVWEVQTPQGFYKDVLFEAHERFRDGTATDDAMLVERMGVPVKVVMGDYQNLKITTPEDLIIAETLLSARSTKGS